MGLSAPATRSGLKRGLARLERRVPARGTTILIYHRVGGGTTDERDVELLAFERQLDVLSDHNVVALDAALDALDAGDAAPQVVLTFDDGFADLYDNAFPLLVARGLPFTVYVASAYIGGRMHWEGSTVNAPAPALSWEALEELAASPLCTVGNHTHRHVRPAELTTEELDRCTATLYQRFGITVRHFAYPWGIPVRELEPALRTRFRSAATGEVGRNLPGTDPVRLCRIPVRRTDPPAFFDAKLHGSLGPERTYAAVVAAAKRVRVRA